MNVRIVSCVSSIFHAGGIVSAADLVAETPPAPVEQAAPLFTWSGFYHGMQGGGAWGNGDFSGIGSSNMNGGLVGGFVGYNWQLDNSIVLGVEGDASYNWNEAGCRRQRIQVRHDWIRSRPRRLCHRPRPALRRSRLDRRPRHVDTPIGSDSATFSGWTVGAGLDYAFTDNVFGRVEYRYNDYGSKDLMGVDTDFNQNVVRRRRRLQILMSPVP
jgi:outer membrane immunogenic protein